MRNTKKPINQLKMFAVRLPPYQIAGIKALVQFRRRNKLTLSTTEEVMDLAVSEFLKKHGGAK